MLNELNVFKSNAGLYSPLIVTDSIIFDKVPVDIFCIE